MIKFRNSSFVFLFLLIVFVYPIFGEEKQQTSPASAAPDASTTAYRIEKGDELEIKSIHNPEINTQLVVRPDGKISMPLAPEIMAAGKTPQELSAELAQKYSVEYTQPEVAVIVKSFNGHRVFVGGEVKKPGIVSLAGPLTVLQAISQAEGFTDNAKPGNVVLIRKAANNEKTTLVVDLKKAMNGSDPKQDMQLKPYDIIYVPRSGIANVRNFFQTVIRGSIPIW